jgi:hypothetical protein
MGYIFNLFKEQVPPSLFSKFFSSNFEYSKLRRKKKIRHSPSLNFKEIQTTGLTFFLIDRITDLTGQIRNSVIKKKVKKK